MRSVRGRRSERGATIVMVAVAMTALLSMVALAVDIGMLFNARSEAQRAADAAALAGAGKLITHPTEDAAREEAIEFGELNTAGGLPAVILDEDVEVDLAEQLVRVTVRRTADRGSAMPTWFARVFGTDAVDVAAVAAAKIEPAGRLKCAKPFTIPDLYDDVNGNGIFDEGIDIYADPTADPPPDEDDYTGYGSAYRNTGQPGDNGLGLKNDRGLPLIIKGGGPEKANECCPNTGPGWYYLWAYGGRGGRNLRDNIANLCENNELIAIGEEYDVEPGVKYGPVDKGIQDLLDADPGATWDEICQCVVGSRYGDDWETSERVFAIPVFNPGRAFRSGRKPIEFSNFIGVFLERIENKGNKQHVHVRFLYTTGIGGGDFESSGAKYPRLVE